MNQPPNLTSVPPLSPQKNSGLAVWSLVCGILGFFCLLTSVPAVICGHIALSQIKASAGALTGRGMAIAGLVMGYICIAIMPIALLAAIAIPNFVRARDTALKNACINHLRQIDGAKQQWALDNKKQSTDIPTSEELQKYLKDGMFPNCRAGGTYIIGEVAADPMCSLAETKGHTLSPTVGGRQF